MEQAVLQARITYSVPDCIRTCFSVPKKEREEKEMLRTCFTSALTGITYNDNICYTDTERRVIMATNKSIIQARYDKTHTKNYGLKLNLVTDSDIIEKLSSVPNVQAYIKQAIRKDIDSVPDSVPKTTEGEEE